jgi:alkanesulfonate monooxygenase SsuD/methylene tetrahydromethanopterin reductase-like flavin-dependent oxidoreductase (luciferase family)
VGWLEEEFRVLGSADFKRRGKATDEYLEIFKAICAGGEVAYRGETYAFEPVFSAPGSLQRPHPPILIGGLSDAALRRVVRHGDGWLAVTAGPDMLAERIALLGRLADAGGRRLDDLTLAYKLFLSIGESRRSAYDAREPGTGTAAEIADDLKRLFDLGFTKIIVRHRGESIAQMTHQIDRFATEIVPRV